MDNNSHYIRTHVHTHSSHFPCEYWLASELFSVATLHNI